MPSERSLDLVLFGASSFVGALTANYLAAQQTDLRWALAGRNLEKLEAVRRALPSGAPAPELMRADVSDPASIRALAERARVVLTTVGPYTRYGEGLVAACAELGSDYVDLTGEPGFFARSLARYDEPAARSGARILHACGFDSIPHDLGALFTLNALRQRLPAAELDTTPITIEAVVRAKGGVSGGTWQSALLIMSEVSFSGARPSPVDGRSVSKLPPRIHYRKDLGVWAMPAPTIDPEIVCHSARLLREYGPQFRYGHFIGLKYLPQVGGFLLGAGSLLALAKLPPARALLGKLNPPGRGPSQAERDQGFFRVTFTGRAGTERVRCEVSGGDPGYGDTAKMMAETGLSLVFDRARLPVRAGVLTTAAALGEVLIERLQRAGMGFQQLPD